MDLIESLRLFRSRLPDLADDQLLELFWLFHPRYRFIKSLPWGVSLIDIGAGDGALAYWREWGKPDRSDLRLYGGDLTEGAHRRLYDGWECLDLDERSPSFPNVELNAFIASHVIEHLREPERLIRWIADRGQIGSRIYLEWPSRATLDLPTKDQLRECGIDVAASNFKDDETHKECPDLQGISAYLQSCGLAVTAQGEIDLGVIGEEMFARANEPNLRTMGYWSITRWCVFVEARKIADPS
jgi:SAM-dependent methyltransferase